MAENVEAQIEETVAQRFAPALALRHLPDLHAEWEYLLRPFLRELPTNEDGTSPLMSLEVSVSVDGSRYAIRAAAATHRMIDGMVEFFGEVGADPDALETLSEIGAEVDPLALGMWLELSAGSANSGWWIPEDDIEDLPAILVNPEHASTIRAWADSAGVGNFMAAGRSVAEGDVVAFVSLPLPGATANERITHALTLLGAFEVHGPADEAIATMLSDEAPNQEIVLWLLPDGVARTALRTTRPGLAMTLDVAATAPYADPDLLAQLQGILIQQEVGAVEAMRRGDSDEVLVAWELAES